MDPPGWLPLAVRAGALVKSNSSHNTASGAATWKCMDMYGILINNPSLWVNFMEFEHQHRTTWIQAVPFGFKYRNCLCCHSNHGRLVLHHLVGPFHPARELPLAAARFAGIVGWFGSLMFISTSIIVNLDRF